METSTQEVYNLIGYIKCVDVQENEDGSCKVVFDYDKKFKDEYKRLFKLKKFSKKHFEEQLHKAIKNFVEQVEADKNRLIKENKLSCTEED